MDDQPGEKFSRRRRASKISNDGMEEILKTPDEVGIKGQVLNLDMQHVTYSSFCSN